MVNGLTEEIKMFKKIRHKVWHWLITRRIEKKTPIRRLIKDFIIEGEVTATIWTLFLLPIFIIMYGWVSLNDILDFILIEYLIVPPIAGPIYWLINKILKIVGIK